ncbi:DUF4406 domain-containing protein [Malikia sp.]|uniref:DUF4406 domain-containing protein n=1 Tax=Malikia sp. TaxID=2070706 RepID=UPI0026036BA1|nr:DUF4406 domain-containing protein [Malikia sp.]MDD2728301.1 DUF4406 domain-containing protein [Malikia sp.]
MPSITLTLTDTPAGGVSLTSSFQPAIGYPCSAAQAYALDIMARTRKDWGLQPEVDASVPTPRAGWPRLYLCGPMTGLPDYNYPAFNEAAAQLRALGYAVVNPAENGLPASATWAQHMRADIKGLCDCAALAVLPGSQASKGAQLEIELATRLELTVASVATWSDLATSGQMSQLVQAATYQTRSAS